jgi:uncharacterized protein (TIGR03067 family)
MSKLLLTAALVGFVLGAAAVADDKAAPKLVGGYTLVSGESGGKAIPAEKIAGATVRFTADKIVTTDKDKREIYVASYTLDTSKTPHVIRMKSEVPKDGSEATGIIKKEGDTVTLAYTVRGGEPPAEFKTREGQNLFVLKNLSAKAGTE